MKDIIRQRQEYIAPIGWLLLVTTLIVFGVELLSIYVDTYSYIATTSGTEAIL